MEIILPAEVDFPRMELEIPQTRILNFRIRAR